MSEHPHTEGGAAMRAAIIDAAMGRLTRLAERASEQLSPAGHAAWQRECAAVAAMVLTVIAAGVLELADGADDGADAPDGEVAP